MKKSHDSAQNFVTLLKNGKIRKEILPNTSPDYTISQETEDLYRYKRFLQSFAYDDILDCEVRTYNGDQQ